MKKATFLLVLILAVAFIGGTCQAQGVYIPFNVWDGFGYNHPGFIPEEFAGWHTTCIGASFVDKAPKPIPPPPPQVVERIVQVPTPPVTVIVTKIVPVFPPVFFGVNNKAVKCIPGTIPTLNRVGKYLQDNPNDKVEITGYTDSTGTAAKNQTLSEGRAQSVQKYLVDECSISKDRLPTKGMGANDPIADNSTAAGRAQNRRVEFRQIN